MKNRKVLIGAVLVFLSAGVFGDSRELSLGGVPGTGTMEGRKNTWHEYLVQTGSGENPVLVEWLVQTEDLGALLDGLGVLADREDPDFLMVLEYLRLNSRNNGGRGRRNGSSVNIETALSFFLEKAHAHCLRDDSWDFWGKNRRELENMLLSLSEWETPHLRANLLNFLHRLDPGSAALAAQQEQEILMALLRENQGRLPAAYLMEAEFFARSAARLDLPGINDMFLRLYLESRDARFSEIIRSSGLVSP